MYRSDIYLQSSHFPVVRKEHGLGIQASTSYLVKCMLGELFGDKKPLIWRMSDQGALTKVSAYTSLPVPELQSHAQVVAPPAKYAACNWERSASKPVPHYDGLYIYETRVCPAVQKSSSGSGTTLEGETFSWSAGSELDVFLSEIGKGNDPVDRESVYAKWLRDQFAMDQHDWGAVIRSARVDRWTLTDTTVTTGGTTHIRRPDATLSGRIEIRDSGSFRSFLGQGVGKLKAFGFGMIDIVDVV